MTHAHVASGSSYVKGCEGCRELARQYQDRLRQRRLERTRYVHEVRDAALPPTIEPAKPEPAQRPEPEVEYMLTDARALIVALASGDNRGAAMLLNGLDRKELERVAITLCALIARRDALNGKL